MDAARPRVITAGRIITPSGDLTPGSVEIDGGRIVSVRAGAAPGADLSAADGVLAPALLDAVPGAVRLVTLAPELPGAAGVIRVLRERGCVVAAGHTAATYEQAQAAFGAGVTLATHLFNAMRPVHHRDPGIVVAALEHPQVDISLIADFIHVHPAMVRLAVQLKKERVALITDAIAAAGSSRRVTRLGTRTVRVTDVPRLPDGTIAGSVLSMDAALRHTVSVGVSLRDAVLMASTIPARVIGRNDLGRIEVGKPADLVVLTREFRVRAVYTAGGTPHRVACRRRGPS